MICFRRFSMRRSLQLSSAIRMSISSLLGKGFSRWMASRSSVVSKSPLWFFWFRAFWTASGSVIIRPLALSEYCT